MELLADLKRAIRMAPVPERLALLVPAILLGIGIRNADAGDWPQWRGPARDGVAAGETLPDPLPDTLRLIWKVQVGEGHSSPVVVGDRVYLMARRDDDEFVLGLDASDGSEAWAYHYAQPYKMNIGARRHGKGPKSTVAVTEGRVFALGIGGALTCLDAASGEVVWSKQYEGEFGQTSPAFGTASSPLVEGELVIVQVGGKRRGALIAYEQKSGAEAWRTVDEGPAYASPVWIGTGDSGQIVTFTRESLKGVRNTDGKKLWSLEFKTSWNQSSVTPLFVDGLLVYSGLHEGVFAVRIREEESQPSEAWTNKRHNFYLSSPVAFGGHLYAFSNRKKGQLVCMDVATGEVKWENEGRLGDNASLTRAGDVLLVLTTEAELQVVAASGEKYQKLAAWEVADSPTWAHLAFANGRLYVKDKTSLTCFGF
jgi:outer membrane protein assembly factor BamB